MPIKDFRSDIRANRDLEKFLVSPVVMLDVTHTSMQILLLLCRFLLLLLLFLLKDYYYADFAKTKLFAVYHVPLDL